VSDLREVKAAYVEDDGVVSIVRRPWAEPARAADVDAEAVKEMKRDIGDRSRPTGLDRTDAAEWLR
jgi:uncharacterized membrane protein YcaP (DUF421 family)